MQVCGRGGSLQVSLENKQDLGEDDVVVLSVCFGTLPGNGLAQNVEVTAYLTKSSPTWAIGVENHGRGPFLVIQLSGRVLERGGEDCAGLAPAVEQADLTTVRALRARAVELLRRLAVREEELLSAAHGELSCPVCLDRPKSLAYRCGHMVCIFCCPQLDACPICNSSADDPRKVYV